MNLPKRIAYEYKTMFLLDKNIPCSEKSIFRGSWLSTALE